jgi:very-short-patch-repair endonuclease
MAAVLACEPHAFVSHHSAAGLWRPLPYPAKERPIDLIVSGRNPGPKPGIRIHRTKTLRPDETTILDAIPLTIPARTILDLAATASARELEWAIAEAHARGRAARSSLLTLIARHPRHRGAKPLAGLLELDRDPARVRSEAEAKLLVLIRRAKLPDPETNVPLHGFEIDFLWRDARLVVEVDGLAYHSSGSAIRNDRNKEAVLARHGFEVIRVIWSQIVDEPEATIARIAARQALRTR